MSISVQIPPTFLGYTNYVEVIRVNGKIVGECFHDLVSLCPDLEKAIFNKDGSFSSYIPVIKNNDYSLRVYESSKVEDGDVLSIVFLSG